jgi:hypothetical protein
VKQKLDHFVHCIPILSLLNEADESVSRVLVSSQVDSANPRRMHFSGRQSAAMSRHRQVVVNYARCALLGAPIAVYALLLAVPSTDAFVRSPFFQAFDVVVFVAAAAVVVRLSRVQQHEAAVSATATANAVMVHGDDVGAWKPAAQTAADWCAAAAIVVRVVLVCAQLGIRVSFDFAAAANLEQAEGAVTPHDLATATALPSTWQSMSFAPHVRLGFLTLSAARFVMLACYPLLFAAVAVNALRLLDVYIWRTDRGLRAAAPPLSWHGVIGQLLKLCSNSSRDAGGGVGDAAQESDPLISNVVSVVDERRRVIATTTADEAWCSQTIALFALLTTGVATFVTIYDPDCRRVLRSALAGALGDSSSSSSSSSSSWFDVTPFGVFVAFHIVEAGVCAACAAALKVRRDEFLEENLVVLPPTPDAPAAIPAAAVRRALPLLLFAVAIDVAVAIIVSCSLDSSSASDGSGGGFADAFGGGGDNGGFDNIGSIFGSAGHGGSGASFSFASALPLPLLYILSFRTAVSVYFSARLGSQ